MSRGSSEARARWGPIDPPTDECSSAGGRSALSRPPPLRGRRRPWRRVGAPLRRVEVGRPPSSRRRRSARPGARRWRPTHRSARRRSRGASTRRTLRHRRRSRGSRRGTGPRARPRARRRRRRRPRDRRRPSHRRMHRRTHTVPTGWARRRRRASPRPTARSRGAGQPFASPQDDPTTTAGASAAVPEALEPETATRGSTPPRAHFLARDGCRHRRRGALASRRIQGCFGGRVPRSSSAHRLLRRKPRHRRERHGPHPDRATAG